MAHPTVVLVHGSWHGPWCWDRVIPELAKHEIESVAVALPSCDADSANWRGLEGDARAVAGAAAAVGGPVAVLGHSYGGVAISAAEMPANVSQLIYLGAFMPDSGKCLVDYLPPGPLPPYVTIEGGQSVCVAEQAPGHLYNTCLPADAAMAVARLVPQDPRVVTEPVAAASWRGFRSDYILLHQDRAIPPDLQEVFAAQADDRHEMDSDHSPFLCQPGALAALVARIAAPIAV